MYFALKMLDFYVYFSFPFDGKTVIEVQDAFANSVNSHLNLPHLNLARRAKKYVHADP